MHMSDVTLVQNQTLCAYKDLLMSEMIFLLMLFGLPAALGCYMARQRGKNPLLWGLLSGVFPFFLVVLHMQYKRLDKGGQPSEKK